MSQFWNVRFIFQLFTRLVLGSLLFATLAKATTTCQLLLLYPQNFSSHSGLLAKAEAISEFKTNAPFYLTESIQKVIFSKKIVPGDLPYETGLRPPISRSPAILLGRAEELNELSNVRVTNTVIGSEGKSSMFSLVRLGFLADGRPVAVKTIKKIAQTPIRNELRGASILSDLGIFPLLHGVLIREREVSIVTDIVPGDVQIQPSNTDLFEIQQLIEVFNRLTGVGIFKLPYQETVLQYIRGSDQKILLIDADGFYERIKEAHNRLVLKLERGEPFAIDDMPPRKYSDYEYQGYDWSKILAQHIQATDAKTALTILNQLKTQGGVLWTRTIEELGEQMTFKKAKLDPMVANFVAEN